MSKQTALLTFFLFRSPLIVRNGLFLGGGVFVVGGLGFFFFFFWFFGGLLFWGGWGGLFCLLLLTVRPSRWTFFVKIVPRPS